MKNKAKISGFSVLAILPMFLLTPAVLVYAAINSPTVTTSSPNYITDTLATAKASVNPNGYNTNVWFEWTYDPNNFYYKTSPQSVGNGQSSITVFADLKPLVPDRLYYYRAAVGGNNNTVYGSTVTFRTKNSGSSSGQNSSGAPSISTRGSQDISYNNAVVKAEVNPRGSNTSVWFEWGSSASGLISQTPLQFIGNGSVSVNVLAGLYSLSPDTVYFFRPVARNDNGIVYGSTLSFKTRNTGISGPSSSYYLPVVATKAVRSVDAYSVIVEAIVNPQRADAQVWFEWGLVSEGLVEQTPRQSVGRGSAVVSVITQLSSLLPGEVYSYRAVAENSAGIVYGSTLIFSPKTPDAAKKEEASSSLERSFVLALEVKNLTFPNGSSLSDTAAIGDILEYTLKIKNEGDPVLIGIVVKSPLSSYVEFIEAVPVVQNLSTGALEWRFSSFGGSEVKTISFKVKTKTVTKNVVISNSFTLESSSLVKTSNQTITLLNSGLMAIDISTNKTEVERGDEIIYSARYRNVGIADTDAIIIKVVLPAGTELKATEPAVFSQEGNTLIFKSGKMLKNQIDLLNIRVLVKDEAEKNKNLITTAFVDFTDVFGNVQPGISITNSVKVKGGIIGGLFGGLTATAAFLPGSLIFWSLFILVILISSVCFYAFYTRRRIYKLLKP